MRRLRILFISHDSTLYGAQICLAEFLRRIDKNRFDPFLLAPYEGPLNDLVRGLGIPVIVRQIRHWVVSRAAGDRTRATILFSNLRGLRGRMWAVAHQIENLNIDIVYTNTVTVLEGALAARFTGRPHVWHLHEVLRGNDEVKGLLPQWAINRIIRRLSNELVVNSRFNERAYGLNADQGNGVLIYNGIDTDKFSPKHKQVPNPLDRFRQNADTKLVAVLGGLHPRKGHANLIEAAYILKQTLPNIRYLLTGIGYPDYLSRLQKHIAARGLQDSVIFLGWVDDHPTLLANVDLLVSAAHQESFGLTIVEAMASGTPVVATASGGPQEIIVDRVHGRLVPVDNPEALADAILGTLSDPVLMSSYVDAGLTRARSAFTLQQYVSAIEHVLDRLARSAVTEQGRV